MEGSVAVCNRKISAGTPSFSLSLAAYVFSHMAEFTNRFWTGLHRPKNETKFRWSDNHPLDYTQWSAYPARRMLHLRSCVHAYYSKSSPGYWVDGNCTAKLPFVCKIGREDKEVVPEHPGNCEAGWLKFDKYCYLVSNSYYGTKVWSDARQRCRDKGNSNSRFIHYCFQMFV